jgi:hypothetical protein
MILLKSYLWQDAVADYIRTFSGRLVETEDFRKILERHSGLNLTRFFDQVNSLCLCLSVGLDWTVQFLS